MGQMGASGQAEVTQSSTVLPACYFKTLPFSCPGKCPKPLKNRDVITLRSWLPMGTDYIIMNYSVKHPVSAQRSGRSKPVGELGQGLGFTEPALLG